LNSTQLDSLVDELMCELEVMVPELGLMVDQQAFYKVLASKPWFTRAPYPFPRGELKRYLADELQTHLGVPPPSSIRELREVLVQVAPERIELFLARRFGKDEVPQQLPFSGSLLADIEQQDVDVLHRAMDVESAPLGFGRTDPLCYGWLALHYFSVNVACACPMSRERPADMVGAFDLCGAPSVVGHRRLPPMNVDKINQLLLEYSRESIRSPALFFLGAHAGLMQSSVEVIRNSRKYANRDMRRVISWARNVQKTIRDLLFVEPIHASSVIHRRRARRILAGASSYPPIVITRAIEELREPLEQLDQSVDETIEDAKRIAKEQDVVASKGLGRRGDYPEIVQRCALAIGDVMAAGPKARGKARKPVKPVLELLELWGATVNATAFHKWRSKSRSSRR